MLEMFALKLFMVANLGYQLSSQYQITPKNQLVIIWFTCCHLFIYI